MKNIARLLFVTLIMVGVAIPGKASIWVGDGKPSKGNRELKETTAGCSPSSAYEWLNINNVKTRYNAGGDMWWDLPGGIGSQYFIPANGSATSLFAGALWIAGLDINLQLKCSAVRFRQGPQDHGLNGGNDFWTGPLTLDGANIDALTCAQWDRIWKINRSEVDEFISHLTGPKPDANSRYGTFEGSEDYEIPKIIREWPAHPEVVGGNISGCSHYMAPFYDNDKNGEYDPERGDFPYYDISNELCHTKTPTLDEQNEPERIHGSILSDQVLKGDQTLWWVFNDKGNSHTESYGSAIGLEIRAQAFGFSTNDEINNMTFCSYEIINRSTYELTGTYFCPWTDVDLGYAQDDYVGCDVKRGLGYGYNGSDIDGNGQPEAYGTQPPAVGVDFFQGPYMDPDGQDNPKYRFTVTSAFAGIDPVSGDSIFVNDTVGKEQLCDESINGVNFGNGIIDDERFGMRRFLYHENGASTDGIGDPQYASDYYNFLRGIWSNGSPMLYGGNALNDGVVGPECVFMFPGDSDFCNWGTNGLPPGDGYNTNGKYWTDAGTNPYGDRRFMQSAGPFTLKPGAVNYITFGVPWARANSGGAWASVELLRVTDDKCQALFDNCFKVIDGPSAPDLTIRELDQKLIIYLSYSSSSNNYKEGYIEIDPEIPEYRPDDSTKLADRHYRFEGYKVYQLVNDEVGADELGDNSKARLAFQCDIQNGVSKLVNYEWDEHIGGNVPMLKVEGGDAGITHSFVVTEDLFSMSDNATLVNHKTYYYMAVAYAYNNFMDYAQDPNNTILLSGQQKPYLEGRKDIKCYSAVPHKIVNGTVMQCEYGQKPAVTRIVGQGNGGNELELTQESVNEIFTKKLANSTDEYGNQVVFGHPDYPIVYHPSYKIGYGPLDVKVIDPLNVKSANYELWFDAFSYDTTFNVSTNTGVHYFNHNGVNYHSETKPCDTIQGSFAIRKSAHWYLKDLDSDEAPAKSDTIITYADEKMFIDRGISITVAQPYPIGPVTIGSLYESSGSTPGWYTTQEALAKNSGMITSSLIFQDSTNKWLDGIRDKDLPGSDLNWIRAGTYYDKENTLNSDYNMNGGMVPYDPNESFEKIANRTWAPFSLCAFKTNAVFPTPSNGSIIKNDFSKTASVDIVLTADRSKWTRCPVIEMCIDDNLSENNAKRFYLRKSASVDQDGNPYMLKDVNGNDSIPFNIWGNTDEEYLSNDPNDPNFIAPQGMGWFPGYVIDVESGARLNIAFGEDSYLEDLNGRDMLFNPPAVMKNTVDEANGDNSQYYDPAIYRQVDMEPVFGGKHYVYVFGMDKPDPSVLPVGSPYPIERLYSPAYDGGFHIFDVLNIIQNGNNADWKNLHPILYSQCMYVGMPMAVEGTTWLAEGNDATIRIRVSKPYAEGYASVVLDSLYDELDINGLHPKYQFAIEGLDPILNDPEKTVSDLDLVNIVPNPYYAFSEYEDNALNNKVKITNLPNNCTVTIYNLSGTKIRQFKKDNELPSIEWDLTNFANTPVASGFYLIHVKDNTSGGERTIKFFGAMRLIDLNTF